jgi:hypothetical protein
MAAATHPHPRFNRGLDDPSYPVDTKITLTLRVHAGDPDHARDHAIDTIVNALRDYGPEGQVLLDLLT